jgi:hypothetical protein
VCLIQTVGRPKPLIGPLFVSGMILVTALCRLHHACSDETDADALIPRHSVTQPIQRRDLDLGTLSSMNAPATAARAVARSRSRSPPVDTPAEGHPVADQQAAPSAHGAAAARPAPLIADLLGGDLTSSAGPRTESPSRALLIVGGAGAGAGTRAISGAAQSPVPDAVSLIDSLMTAADCDPQVRSLVGGVIMAQPVGLKIQSPCPQHSF